MTGAPEVPEREVVRRGYCLRCGNCCFVSKSQPKVWQNILKPSALGHNFRQAETVERDATVVIEDKCCKLHISEDGKTSCDDYLNRPPPCRSSPRTHGELIPGCGYWFVLLINGEERKTYGEVRE